MVERLTNPNEIPVEMREVANTFEDARKKLTDDIEFAVKQSAAIYGSELGMETSLFTVAIVMVEETIKILMTFKKMVPEHYESSLPSTKCRFEVNLGWKIEK